MRPALPYLCLVVYLVYGLPAQSSPLVVNVGDTLGVSFRFDTPFEARPQILQSVFYPAPGNSYNDGEFAATLFDGRRILGMGTYGGGGGVGPFFTDRDGPMGGFSPIAVDFTGIQNRTIDGRVEVTLTKNSLVYDPQGSAQVLVQELLPSGGGGFAQLFAGRGNVLSVDLNGRTIYKQSSPHVINLQLKVDTSTLPSLPPVPTTTPTINLTPSPGALLSAGATAFLGVSLPAATRNWINHQIDSLEIYVGQNDSFYPAWLKKSAGITAEGLTVAKGAYDLYDSLDNLYEINQQVLKYKTVLTPATLAQVQQQIYQSHAVDIAMDMLGVFGGSNAVAGKVEQWIGVKDNTTLDRFTAMFPDCVIANITTGCVGLGLDAISTARAFEKGPQAGLVALNAMIYGDLLAPAAAQYAKDPLDPNYTQMTLPTKTLNISLPSTGNADLDQSAALLLQSSFRASQYLEAVNKSFDRYTSAYNAGDTRSALLQYESILYYLGLYKQESTENARLLSAFQQALALAGFSDGSAGPATLAAFQQELLQNGLPSDVIGLLSAVGLSDSDVSALYQKLGTITPSDLALGSATAALGAMASAMSLTVPQDAIVPEGDGRILFCIGMVGLLLVHTRRISRACSSAQS